MYWKDLWKYKFVPEFFYIFGGYAIVAMFLKAFMSAILFALIALFFYILRRRTQRAPDAGDSAE